MPSYRPNAPGIPVVLALAAALVALGCGARRPVTGSPTEDSTGDGDNIPDEVLRADPMHVRAVRDKERLAVEAYDASGLFDRAAALLRKGRCEDAVTLYERLVREFADSTWAAPALYNSGLCHEQLEAFESAAADYQGLVERYPESRDVSDALFRLASVYEKLEAWSKSAVVYQQLLVDKGKLEGIERVEAGARLGGALIQLDRDAEARLILDEVRLTFRTSTDVSPTASNFYYAMALFKLGEILHREMSAVELPAQESEIEPALDKKCQLLLDAQRGYTKAIEVAHPHWAAAAAYRIGSLYRNLWDDMTGAPPPDDLNTEEREIYLEVLRARIRVLLKKAVVQWERTLKMARRLGLSNEWVEQTTSDLEQIRDVLLAETLENRGKGN